MIRVWPALILIAALCGCGGPAGDDSRAAALADVHGAATGLRFLYDAEGLDGFERALAPRELIFPRDHGPHESFRSEWWYFTGNLDSAVGEHFGFELTFFRVALLAEPRVRQSAWGASQVWMAHFAVTDVAGRRFIARERFARGALGLAGAAADPFNVWVKDWGVAGRADADRTDLTLAARDGDVGLRLTLQGTAPPVAQGNGGLDAKGPEPGNASFYYSMPMLEAAGSVEVDGVTVEVAGKAWMDREWGTSALSDGVVGWDWFALQLSDGRALMYYRLREASGGASAFSGGSLAFADGRRLRLDADDVTLVPVEHWRSPRTGVSYPVEWRLGVPRENLALVISPFLEDQELDLSVRYWEGAVHVEGFQGGSAVAGSGYLELAGY